MCLSHGHIRILKDSTVVGDLTEDEEEGKANGDVQDCGHGNRTGGRRDETQFWGDMQ